MKLVIWCVKCSVTGKGSIRGGTAELRDDSLYEIECHEGHRVVAVLQNLHHELLFDSGAMAFRDGYHREAVASFAAALESFYGFFTRAVLRHLGVDQELIDDVRKATKQSERKLGAMHAAHAILTGRRSLDSDERRRFRNEIVHEGAIPTPERTFQYATYVYDSVVDGVIELRNKTPEALNAEAQAHVVDAHNR